MTYTKFHDPWGSGSCCGTPDPGPNTPIVKAALNAWEQGIFDAHTLVTAAGTDEMQSSRVTGDTNPRYQQLANGTINWGSGSAPADTSLLRLAPGVLYTPGSMDAANFNAFASNPGDWTFTSTLNPNAVPRFIVDATGHLYWTDGTNPADTDLFRSSAGVLRTGAQFSINKVGTGTDAELRLSRDAGFLANIRMRTGTLDRWGIQTSNTAESGANAGSDLNFQRFDDAGVLIGNVMNMTRSTGVVMITTPGNANGAVVSVDGTQSLVNKVYQGSNASPTAGNISMKVTGDTSLRWILDVSGSMSWSPGAGAQDTFLKRGGPGILLAQDTQFQSSRASAGLLSFSALVNGDTVNRWTVAADGKHQWGSGSGAADCTLQRVSSTILQATDTSISSSRSSTGLGGIGVQVNGDTQARWQALAGGTISWGPGNAAQDVTMARTGAATLTMTGTLIVGGDISLLRTSTQTSLNLYSTAGFVGGLFLRDQASLALRWGIFKTSTAEGGANAGSDLLIRTFTDAGGALVDAVTITRSTGAVSLGASLKVTGNVGFYNTTPVAKPTVTGSRGGNAALASLLTALAGQGLLTDSSTA